MRNKPNTKKPAMLIMLRHRNIQVIAVVLFIFVLLYWLWGSSGKDTRAEKSIKDPLSGAKTTLDTTVKDTQVINTLEKVIKTMKTETEKMRTSFEKEKMMLNEKHTKISIQLDATKQQLEKSKKSVKLKNSVLTGLEERIRNVSSSNDKLSDENESLRRSITTMKRSDMKMKPFRGKKLVHFDLKGAPPKLDYLIDIMKYAKQYGADGFLIEYEDMFPWAREMEILKSKHAYSPGDIAKILKTAADEDLVVVPLIQTFGHLEFVLKHSDYKHLRADKEITNVICPINKGSVPLIKRMIAQVLALHPNCDLIHLGGDEVYNLKTCTQCKASNMSDFELYTHHMLPLFQYVKSKRTADGVPMKPIIWDDMLRKWDLDKLKVMAEHVTPMVWAYVPDLSTYHNFPDGMWDRFGTAFPTLWIASSFKGALKPWSNFVPVKQHLDNHLSWLKIIASLEKMGSKVVGVALTGWSRFDHYGPLCELLPAGIPSLALSLTVLAEGNFNSQLHKDVSEKLKFKKPFLIGVTYFKGYAPEIAGYPGGDVYEVVGALEKAIGWYDWSTVRIVGWTRPYNKKRKFLSFFQLNTTLFGLTQSKNQLNALKQNAFDTLTPIFDKDTVDEWIEDKIGHYLEIVGKALVDINQMIDQFSFT